MNSTSASWQKTPLATTSSLMDQQGFPLFDKFGDSLPALPSNYKPSLLWDSSELHIMKVGYSQLSDPPEIGSSGFPILGDYYQLSLLTLTSGVWSTSAPITELTEGLDAPTLIPRNDSSLPLVYWIGNLFYIHRIAEPANTRITLPMPKRIASAVVDENGGVHVLTVNQDYELWHYYYMQENLTSTKLSDGPVCNVAVAAGEGDECHVVFSTFSEDVNFNGQLDEGEDLNNNSTLEDVPMQLIYQSIDAATPSSIELVDNDTILKVRLLDLYFSTDHGLKLAYTDPVENSVRLAERGGSSWASVNVSTVKSSFQSLALSVSPVGDCAVSYVDAAGMKLYIAEESVASWVETLISESSKGNYFAGVDSAFDNTGQVMVLTSEKDRYYLNLYSRAAIPDLLGTLVRPTLIRSAFIITWPTPSEGATKQILQSNTNLADSEGWVNIEQRSTSFISDEPKETTVEVDGPDKFYRVIEQFD